MKNKLIEFLKTKKELFAFLGLLALTFVAVIVIAEVTINDEDEITIAPTPEPEVEEETNQEEDELEEEQVIINLISAPTATSYVIVRDFYNFDTPYQNSNAMIETSSTSITMSKGVGYASVTGETFDVVTIYPGKVVSVEEDEVMGTTITIDHGDLISVYYSLENASVVTGEIVKAEQVIAKAASSSFDINAGVHVHVEVISTINNEYIDLTTLVGKTMDDVVSSIK